MDRSATKKEEKDGRLRWVVRSIVFSIVWPQKIRQRRSPDAQRNNGRVRRSPKKGTRREASGDGTGLRSIGQWIDQPQKKKRKMAACDCSIVFSIVWPQKIRQRRSREAQRNNGWLRQSPKGERQVATAPTSDRSIETKEAAVD